METHVRQKKKQVVVQLTEGEIVDVVANIVSKVLANTDLLMGKQMRKKKPIEWKKNEGWWNESSALKHKIWIRYYRLSEIVVVHAHLVKQVLDVTIKCVVFLKNYLEEFQVVHVFSHQATFYTEHVCNIISNFLKHIGFAI